MPNLTLRLLFVALALAAGLSAAAHSPAISQPSGSHHRRLRGRQRPGHPGARDRVRNWATISAITSSSKIVRGANGTIAAKIVAQSEPDGYTLLHSSAAISSTPFIYKNIGLDVLRDLAPVATVGVLDGYLMLVNPSLPVHSVAEFIAYAKNNRVLYGSPGVGNLLHLAAELFNVKAGLSMQHVPYKGASEVLTALLQGSIQVMFVTPTSAAGLVKEGKLRALATTGAKPLAEFPDLPLLSATVPDYPPSVSWGMTFAPAKTPGCDHR